MCKYCSNLYTGDLSESMTHRNDISFGLLSGKLISDIVIMENDDKSDPTIESNYPTLTFSSWIVDDTHTDIDVIREKFPIHFCPFCGADLNRVREIAMEE